MAGALSHLTVVELASVLAGPSVGMFFAEHGARVIKIENIKTGGDVTRSWKLPSEDPMSKVSAYFASVNWHKEHIFLDFRNSSDISELKKLLGKSDIVIANFKRGDDIKFGLNFDAVKELNPKIIYGSITGFGAESDRVAYDLVLQAEAGYMSMNGTEESGPLKMPVAFIDLFAGHQLREGLLTALLEQQKKTGAYLVEVSLFDSAIASLANQASNWLTAGHLPKRIGSRHPNIAPYGETFATADGGNITFAIGTDLHFSKLCVALNLTTLPTDKKFSNNAARVGNRIELEKILAEKVKGMKLSTLMSELMDQGVPVAEIKNLENVFASEEARKLVLEEKMSGVQTKRVRSSVFKVSRS